MIPGDYEFADDMFTRVFHYAAIVSLLVAMVAFWVVAIYRGKENP